MTEQSGKARQSSIKPSILRIKDNYEQRVDLKIILLIFGLAYSAFIYSLAPPYIGNLLACFHPTVEGKVLNLGLIQPTGRNISDAIKVTELAVSFQWKGQQYTATEEGENLTLSQYKRIQETGRATVYVQERDPAESRISAGLSTQHGIIGGLFLALAIYLSYKSVVILIKLLRHRAGDARRETRGT